MRYLLSVILYTALAATANADMSAREALRAGDMRKLQFHKEITNAPEISFIQDNGSAGLLSDYRGKVVLLNFWATWCAPCRKEMPNLSALQSTLGGDDFTVITIATGPNPPAKITAFFNDIGIDNLPAHRDPRQALAREMRVLGLPATILLDRHGQEIARLLGDANWHSDSALAIIQSLIASEI
jgi:thiol-disulfide isomerase/thioredoxin